MVGSEESLFSDLWGSSEVSSTMAIKVNTATNGGSGYLFPTSLSVFAGDCLDVYYLFCLFHLWMTASVTSIGKASPWFLLKIP